MVKKGQKRALLDAFPAWIVWLQRPGEPPYYKVQPDFGGRVLSHSLTPGGKAHARLWINNNEVPWTSRLVPASAIRYFDVEAGKPTSLCCPASTATVSMAPVKYDSFEIKALRYPYEKSMPQERLALEECQYSNRERLSLSQSKGWSDNRRVSAAASAGSPSSSITTLFAGRRIRMT
jgi:hypothetical protein